MSAKDWQCWRDPAHPVAAHPMFGWPRCQTCRAAPQFWERADYLPPNYLLDVFVPADVKSTAIIAERSAVVGLRIGAERTLVYYEGWINGPMQYADRDARGLWEAGLLHAADRMVTEYPTVAQAYLPATTLQKIGTYDVRSRTVHVDSQDVLEKWLA